MNYIVLDMEWNQPSPGLKIEYKNDRCLANEDYSDRRGKDD